MPYRHQPEKAGIRTTAVVPCVDEIIDSSTRVGFLTLIAFLLIDKGLSTGWATLAVPLILVGGMAGKLACGMLAERVGIIRHHHHQKWPPASASR
jgi:hypothetical protein